MERWPKEAVFCHNDLMPSQYHPQEACMRPSGHARIELAGLIDWKLCWFLPSILSAEPPGCISGGGNRCVSFYLLLKERMKASRSPLRRRWRAMELILSRSSEGYPRAPEGTNIPAVVRKRFRDLFLLVPGEGPYLGWTCKTEGGSPPKSSSRGAAQKLEGDVVAEVVCRRRQKRSLSNAPSNAAGAKLPDREIKR